MWNSFSSIDWQSIRQNVSYRRLAIAIILSLLLHLFLIGQFYVNLADEQKGRSVINATLALPQPVLPKIVPIKPIAKDAVKAKKILPNKPTSTKNISPVAEAPVLAESILADSKSLVNVASVSEPVEPIITDEAPPPIGLADESKLEGADLIVNSNAYRYVETEFDVRTDINAKVDSSGAGKAKIVYQLLPDGKHYQLKSLIEAKGLAALLIPDLLQTSEGLLSNVGLQPTHYLYQFGNKKNKTFSADFNWEQKQLDLHSANGTQTITLAEGTQDLLSFMYQFMFVAPLQNMQLSITNGKKLGIYDYSFEGEEPIATKIGNINTIHLVRMVAEGEKKTELWLALDYQYVPVKIRETEKQGKVYELLVSSLKTEMPAAAPKSATP